MYYNIWNYIKISRNINRPYTLDIINYISDDFIEIFGDRSLKDDKSIIGGISKINNTSFIFIGHQKGRNFKERLKCNFGMSNPEGYRKALRLMKIAEKFNKAIITIIDTPGANYNLYSEKKCQSESIAKNIKEMFSLKVPIISFIIGEGASGGALGISVSDKIFMLKNSWLSVISPESCSSIIWNNIFYKKRASKILRLTSLDMLKLNLIDGIIDESLEYSYNNIINVADLIKEKILNNINFLFKLGYKDIIKRRINKFCNFGIFKEF